MRPLSMEMYDIVMWIETDSGLIYLVDWDSVRLTDRMFDVAHMLCHYIPEHQWKEWLTYYGYKYNQTVLNRIVLVRSIVLLDQISKYYMNQDLENVNRRFMACVTSETSMEREDES